MERMRRIERIRDRTIGETLTRCISFGMPTVVLLEDELTRSVIGAFFEVYNTLGFGFLEHIYTAALERELRNRNHEVAREVGVRIMYKGDHLAGQRLDMIVDGKVVIEVKSGQQLPPVALRQLFNYLKSTNIEVGLLLHFGPEPKFYRQVRSNNLKSFPAMPASDPPNPPDPRT